MIRSFQELQKRGLRKVLDQVYYEMIGLCIMYKDYEYSSEAARYAKSTVIRSSFDHHRISSPDMYNLFAFLNNISKYKMSKQDEILMKRAKLDISFYVRYLRKMTTGSLTVVELDMFIRRITKELYIEDNILRAQGRMAVSWNRIRLREKKLTLDKMSKYGILNFRYSDVTSLIRKLDSEFVVDEPKQQQQEEPPVPISTSKQKQNWGKIGLAAAGGYALGKFLSREKKDKRPNMKFRGVHD